MLKVSPLRAAKLDVNVSGGEQRHEPLKFPDNRATLKSVRTWSSQFRAAFYLFIYLFIYVRVKKQGVNVRRI